MIHEINSLVTIKMQPGVKELGRVISAPKTIAEVPAAGTFYLVQTHFGPAFIADDRLAAARDIDVLRAARQARS